jgi:hypothetical protein
MLYFDQFKGATGYTGDICQERMCWNICFKLI